MTYAAMNSRHMSCKSAQFAQTNGSCTATMQYANSIAMTMDAAIMASIIISLILGIAIISAVLRLAVVSVLVLVVMALVTVYLNIPSVGRHA